MGAVFLDLDGTLSDSARPITEAIVYALEQLGQDAPALDALRRYVGPPLIETFKGLGATDPDAALGHYRAFYTNGAMLDAPLYDGVFPVLDQLRADGHRMYLMTAKPHVYATKITAHLGLSPYLIREYGPELDGRFNDKADLLAHACAELGEAPETSVMVGDRSSDLRAGHANGMPVIAALWGYGNADEMADAEVFLNNPSELPGAVNALVGQGEPR